MTIELAEELNIKLLNSDDVYKVMQYILLREEKIDQEKEHFWMIGLNTRNKILFVELVSMGGVNATTVEPMNVFRVGVLKGAVQAIMAHNHPSGELNPSDIDKGLTDRLIQVGRILDIKVIEHMIISDTSYFSFADTGLIEKLGESTEWVPPYVLIEQIKREEKKIRESAVKVAEKKAKKEGKKEGLKEGENKKAIKVAKAGLKKGIPIKIISELTGLTQKEIENLKTK